MFRAPDRRDAREDFNTRTDVRGHLAVVERNGDICDRPGESLDAQGEVLEAEIHPHVKAATKYN